MCGIFNKANGHETHSNNIKIKNKGFIHLMGVLICHHRAYASRIIRECPTIC